MGKFKRYEVRHMFAVDGVLMTNDHEKEIRELPADVRAHHVSEGNLVEYEAEDGPEVPLAAAKATPVKTKE